MPPLIRIENLWHVYNQGGKRPIEALRGIWLEIQPGEYVVIVGQNGSGKSTLAKHLNGLLLPTRGDVWVNDWNTRDPQHKLAIRATVGMVFQNPDNQIVATIVEEDVAFGPENLGVPHDELRRRVDWALDLVGMSEFRHRPPHRLSGGQKQRVALAGVMAMKPQVLVLDESTALLDPVGRRQVLEIVRRLNREEGLTVIAITHFMEEAIHADRVIVLHQGEIALQGSPREVFRQADRLRALALDVPPITEVAQRLHALDSRIPPDALTVEELATAIQRVTPFKTPRPSAHGREERSTASQNGARAVDIADLHYVYLRNTPLQVTALNGVDFDVVAGETVAVMGPTGSGKSTLIQHLNGLLRPYRGRVRVLEFDLNDPHVDVRALRRRVGLVFQFPEAQLFEETVGKDVAFGPRQLGLSRREVRERVREAMNAVGLDFETFRDRYIWSLSGGEKRRAALAGILALRPEILVLDEPTAGLDPQGRKTILDLIRRLKDEDHRTLVLVSHNMDEIGQLAQRAFVLAEGRTVFSGAPRHLFAQPHTLHRLGLSPPHVTALMHTLANAGLPVRRDCITVEEAVEEIQRILPDDGR